MEKPLNDTQRLNELAALAASVAHGLGNSLGVIKLAVFNIKRKTHGPALDSHIANIEKKILESEQFIDNLRLHLRISVKSRKINGVRSKKS